MTIEQIYILWPLVVFALVIALICLMLYIRMRYLLISRTPIENELGENLPLNETAKPSPRSSSKYSRNIADSPDALGYYPHITGYNLEKDETETEEYPDIVELRKSDSMKIPEIRVTQSIMSDSIFHDGSLSKMIDIDELTTYLMECLDNRQENDPLKTQFEKAREISKMHHDDYATVSNREAQGDKIEIEHEEDDNTPRYITGYSNPKAFIVTQPPEQDSIFKFWQMIWKESIDTIVTLTSAVGNFDNCFNYWPKLTKTITFPEYLIRKFIIKNGNETRCITQYHFIGDEFSEEFIEFAKIVADISQEKPILIHCKKPEKIGTIILCDIAIKMSKEEGRVDFLSVLYNLGCQKPNLLHDVRQYVFIHYVVFEYMLEQKFAIPVDANVKTKIEDMLKEAIVKPLIVAMDQHLQIHRKVVQKDRNLTNYSPHVNTTKIDYTLASSSKVFVAKQPLMDNLGNFWRFVNGSNISTIFSLNELDSTNNLHCIFWKQQVVNFENDLIAVVIIKEIEHEAFTEVNIRTSHKGRTKNIVVYDVKRWKRGAFKPANVLDLLVLWKVAFKDNRKHIYRRDILLTCFDGVRASGLFIAMCILLEKIEIEKMCNVYKAVKLVRRSNAEFVKEWGQLECLYKAAMEYSTIMRYFEMC